MTTDFQLSCDVHIFCFGTIASSLHLHQEMNQFVLKIFSKIVPENIPDILSQDKVSSIPILFYRGASYLSKQYILQLNLSEGIARKALTKKKKSGEETKIG